MSAEQNYLEPIIISPESPEAIGTLIRLLGVAGNYASATWPTANLAIYYPFVLRSAILVTQLWTSNGAASSQTRDVGIFSFDGTKLISSGSTAGSGTTALQLYNVTDTMIGPGIFYMGMSSSGTTNAFTRMTPSTATRANAFGMYQQVTAFPLPANATFATVTNAYVPLFGLVARAPI